MTENEVLIKTPEEAIETIKSNMPTSGYQMLRESLDMAITALKEIQQYRAIGTVEECREAVEKLSLKIVSDLDYDLEYYTCPSCGTTISFMEDGYKSHKCCLNCGQAIQFYENLEGIE